MLFLEGKELGEKGISRRTRKELEHPFRKGVLENPIQNVLGDKRIP